MNETVSSPNVKYPIQKKSDHDISIVKSDEKSRDDVIDGVNKPDIEKKKSGKKYCFMCNKRLKLMSTFDCRCGQLFCPEHRTPEYHNCKFDYTGHGQSVLGDRLQKIDHDKINRF